MATKETSQTIKIDTVKAKPVSKSPKKENENKYDMDDEEKKEIKKEKPTSYDKCPTIQLIIRDNKGWRMFKQDTKTGKLHNISDTKPCTDSDIVFCDNGKYFAVLLDKGVEIYKSSKCRFISFFTHDRVRNVYFSPLNKFIISYHHPRKEDKNGNCFVWKFNKNDCKLIHQFFVSEFNEKAVPFSLSNDEFIATQIIKNKILIYDPKQLQLSDTSISNSNHAIIDIIEVPMVVSVVIAPCHRNKKQLQDGYILAVFAKATTSKGATVTIYEYKYKKKSNQISQRQFFGIDECILLWDPATSYHHNLLVIACSNIDITGKSYYGSQDLFLMSSQAQNNINIKIEVKNKLQDVKWHPVHGKEFVLIDDNPQKISIFDEKGNNIFTIGQYSRNIIRFSNCGRFLWLGGFGNLNGEMTFYDYTNIKTIKNGDNDKKYLNGYAQDNASRYFEWSPDSSIFVTATIYPYMTVDNGFRIYKYNGYKLYEEKLDRLYQVAYRPSLDNVYPDKMVSVKALAQSHPLPLKQAKTKYVPPHLRNKGNKNKGKSTRRYFG